MRALTIIVVFMSLFNALMYAFGVVEPSVFSTVCNNLAIACFAGATINNFPKGERK